MYRTLIIARINPGSEPAIANVFADSDRTELPHRAGVRRRELYALGDVYVHLLETERPTSESLDGARRSREFQRVSERLEPYVSAWLPTWRSPADAVARRFYRWERGAGVEA